MPRGSGASEITLRFDSPDFRALFGKSSQVDAKLKAALRRNIRQAALVAVRDVQQSVLQSPVGSSGGASTGLRAGIAAGVKVQVMTGQQAGVRIVSSGAGLDGSRRSLVRAWDKPGGWRHPVFGNDTWVRQHGRPYFRTVIDQHRPQVTAAVQAAMREAVASL